jgi:hypothetical protein
MCKTTTINNKSQQNEQQQQQQVHPTWFKATNKVWKTSTRHHLTKH